MTKNNYYHKVSEFYDRKAESYDRKYNIEDICHIHTGFFEPGILDDIDETSLRNASGLQKVLVKGQRKVSQRLKELCASEGRYMDVGAGHGGNALELVGETDLTIDAVTISPVQSEIIQARVQEAGFSDRINVILSNVLNVSEDKTYDGAFGVESFCQIADLRPLLEKMHSILKPGGTLNVIDYYSRDPNFKAFFDEYWCCSIHDIDVFVSTLEEVGFHIRIIDNETKTQAPFWKLSANHSHQLLKQNPEPREAERLVRSREFHEFMYEKFMTSDAEYYVIQAQKN